MGSFTNKTIQVVMAMAEGVFQNGANQITVEGLPTSVEIQKQGGDERPSCTVTISNLKIDTVRHLTTLSFRPLQRFKNQITINARGYLISSEFIREVNDNRIPFEEVTIQTIYTPETQSKGTNSKVALKILFQMMKHKLFD